MTWLRGMDDVEVMDCLQPDLQQKLESRLQAFMHEG